LAQVQFADAIKDKPSQHGEYAVGSLSDTIANEAEAFTSYMIQTAYYSGIEAHPFFFRMYEIFASGGMPAGWPGISPNKPEQVSETNVSENMLMLHFGI